MIGAGGIATDAQPPRQFSLAGIKSQPSAEDDYASNALSDERVVRLSELFRRTRERCLLVYRSRLNPVKTSARLRARIKIAGSECKIGEAKRICGVGFLGGDQPAPKPLFGPIRSAERHRTHDAVSIHHRGPLLVSHSAVRILAFLNDIGKRSFQFGVVRHLRAVRLLTLRDGG